MTLTDRREADVTPLLRMLPPRNRTTVATPEKSLTREFITRVLPQYSGSPECRTEKESSLREPCDEMGDQTHVRNRKEKKINGKRESHGGASVSAGVRCI